MKVLENLISMISLVTQSVHFVFAKDYDLDPEYHACHKQSIF